MKNDRRRVHPHESRMDTCPDCIAEVQAERYPFARPAGGDPGRKGPQVVAVHPNPVFMQVFNHDNGRLTWFEVDQANLIELLDTELTRQLR
jgi:hypothetical protein